MITKRTNSFVSAIKFVLIVAFIYMIGVAYTNHDAYLRMSSMIVIVFGALFLLSFDWIKPFIQSLFFKRILFLFVAVCCFSFCFSLISFGFEPVDEIHELFIPIVAMIIGYNLKFNNRQVLALIAIFSIVVLVIIGNRIATDLGSFYIEEVTSFVGKNTVGVLLCTIGSIGIQMAYSPNYNTFERMVSGIVFFISLIFLLTIRGRTATLGLMIIFVFTTIMYITRYKTSTGFKAILGIVFLLLIINFLSPIELIPGSQDYIYNSFFLGKEADVLSDRGVRNAQAIEIIKNSPFLGRLSLEYNVEWVHNYPLLKMSNFGLFGSIPWMLLYIYILINVLKPIVRQKTFDIQNVGYIMMLSPFFVSMGEPTLPYGPGTVTVINFLFFGNAIRHSYV